MFLLKPNYKTATVCLLLLAYLLVNVWELLRNYKIFQICEYNT